MHERVEQWDALTYQVAEQALEEEKIQGMVRSSLAVSLFRKQVNIR
jgi:hypothetical protein